MNSFCLNTEFAKAWKLTGDEKYGQKCAEFLRRFADPDIGYIAKLRSTSGSPVHDGRSFQEVAAAYDLIYDSGFLTVQDHENLEKALRRYMHYVDWFIARGEHNNHEVSLVTGALLSSLVLQDMALAKRFIEGPAGILDLLSAGVLDDGSYFECAMNYNMITAGFFAIAAQACLPWGINIHELKLRPEYGDSIFYSPWSEGNRFLGMSFDRYGPSKRNYRTMKDLWDSLVPMGDYREVAFASNDSPEVNLAGEQETGEGFDHAYYLWADPAYLPILHKIKKRGLLYGIGELPEVKEQAPQSCCFDNAGYAVLRSKNTGRPPREQIQAVLKYGTHGGYHGHFDRLSLLSLMRYGRSFYNPECAWYGYDSFMFKMWVQASVSHNMPVVDGKMQKPSYGKRILFHSGELMQVAAIETTTEWFDPPYGGQTPYPDSFPVEKSWNESRYLPVPEIIRPQGDTGSLSEPVFQRRLLIVTDDYTVSADYLRAEKDHMFDSLMHIKGFKGLSSDKTEFLRHTDQFNTDPFGGGQFITGCDWYQTVSTAKLQFAMLWTDKIESGGRQSKSEHGNLNMDVYSVWPDHREIMIGNFPENLDVARKVYYTVKGDGKVLAEGRLAPWILGAAHLNVSVKGVKNLELVTRIETRSKAKTVFWAAAEIVTAAGKTIALSDLPISTENVFKNNAPGQDYYGGPVMMAGRSYSLAILAEPEKTGGEAVTRIDLTGVDADRLRVVLGGDYPLGDESLHRKTVGVRATGKEARFVSVIESYEKDSVIDSIKAVAPYEFEVLLKDGRRQKIKISHFDGADKNISIQMTEWLNGGKIREEAAGI